MVHFQKPLFFEFLFTGLTQAAYFNVFGIYFSPVTDGVGKIHSFEVGPIEVFDLPAFGAYQMMMDRYINVKAGGIVKDMDTFY